MSRSLNTRQAIRGNPRRQGGFTLIELIVATAIVVILTGLAVPLARIAVQRERERELRYDLWMMRDAIDRYKDAAELGGFQTKVGSEKYPPDLETLVTGVDVSGKKLKFCCQSIADEMDRALRLMDGNQPRVALQQLEVFLRHLLGNISA